MSECYSLLSFMTQKIHSMYMALSNETLALFVIKMCHKIVFLYAIWDLVSLLLTFQPG